MLKFMYYKQSNRISERHLDDGKSQHQWKRQREKANRLLKLIEWSVNYESSQMRKVRGCTRKQTET